MSTSYKLDTNTGYFSGEQLQSFRRGWATHVWTPGGKAHYYVRKGISDIAKSRCKLIHPVRWLYGEGNFPRCRRCEKL